MPPAATREPFARWSESSRRTALAIIAEREICDVNPRFSELNSARGSWSWLDGPHAQVRYDDLSQLVRCEAATLAPAPYLSRFERSGQVVEVRLERLDGGEAIALVHDVTSELRRQRDLQREREALMHEERMHAMGVLASGVAHDLNHALNVIALRVAALRADPQLVCTRRTLDVLARVVGEAARIVARLQDLARRRRDRPAMRSISRRCSPEPSRWRARNPRLRTCASRRTSHRFRSCAGPPPSWRTSSAACCCTRASRCPAAAGSRSKPGWIGAGCWSPSVRRARG